VGFLAVEGPMKDALAVAEGDNPVAVADFVQEQRADCRYLL